MSPDFQKIFLISRVIIRIILKGRRFRGGSESRWRTRGAPMGEPLLISHLLAFSFLRSGTVMYLGRAVVLLPPLGVPKIKIKRKPRLESNTWQWKRLRICLNSLLIQGEKSFSLLKRILHYTRCTMTESRLNDLNELDGVKG